MARGGGSEVSRRQASGHQALADSAEALQLKSLFLQGLWTTQSFTEASITRLADLLGKVTLASLLRNSLVPHSSYEHPTNP